MHITLYHYIHCPFCVRVRLILGLLNIEYKSVVLPYQDELTPKKLTGRKMLPILIKENGETLDESLDIIKYLAQNTNEINNKDRPFSLESISGEKLEKLNHFLDQLGHPIHNLCMPYWVYTKEFNSQSRKYFQEKKETKRGPFNKLILNKKTFLEELSPLLQDLESGLHPFYQSDQLTLQDILIASHLWGMYIFPEFQFSEIIHKYLQEIKCQANFDYHQDLWTSNGDSLLPR